MALAVVAAVACGGAVGAVSRFLMVTLIQTLIGLRFPLGTLAVNCIGAFLIGFLMYFFIERFSVSSEVWRMFAVVGFLGAFTTFSSFAWETWVLYSDGQWVGAFINILANNAGTLLMVLLGVQSGRLLGGA